MKRFIPAIVIMCLTPLLTVAVSKYSEAQGRKTSRAFVVIRFESECRMEIMRISGAVTESQIAACKMRADDFAKQVFDGLGEMP